MAFEKIKVSAPGKIIVSGEHSVVYGYPALLASSNLRLGLEVFKGKKVKSSKYAYYAFKKALNFFNLKNINDISFKIDSKVPIGSGMGSSAALAVSMSAASLLISGKDWDLRKINDLAYEIEKKQHGNPSGGDNTVVCYGGFVWYRKETEDLKVFSRVKPKKTFPEFFIINSGKPKESTREMVYWVKEKYKKHPKKVKGIFNQMEFCTKSFLKYILNEKTDSLKNVINYNQRLLEELGVVSEQTKDLVTRLEKNGASVKVSGAGGRTKGSGILIVYQKDIQKLKNFAKTKKLDMISVSLGGKGVKEEKNGKSV